MDKVRDFIAKYWVWPFCVVAVSVAIYFEANGHPIYAIVAGYAVLRLAACIYTAVTGRYLE